ncbi:hypothetical protein A3K72_04210 [Candidatus Woesearchaeota archaeon RBG_13_36_6]|nr:MAG: hypothetical protein A3K72_04210 [Candidatus Woesearchaeota archaeon RBG_13_36_6]
MIKVILFDIGGCYFQGSIIDFVNKSYKVLGINKIFHTEKEVVFDKALNKGEITLEECFRRYFDTHISDEQMKKIIGFWTTTWSPRDEMVELAKRLKKNYKLGVFSNSDAVNSKNYTKRGWYDIFNILILSHEIGIIKPDKRIYQIAIQKSKAKPEQILFIDDEEDCLKTATELGMKTILFRSVSQFKKELKQMGIKF